MPAPAPESVLSVTQLTRKIRELIELEIGEAWIEGEVSNLRVQRSGHQYFTLKDSGAQLSCVLFKGNAMRQTHLPEDGRKVLLFGEISVYEARGNYQMIVREVRPAGVGDLQAKFDELKRKLAAEGLFDQARKKPLPKFPTRIGVVTSASAAALRDMLHVWERRAPWLRITIFPVRVQGSGAEHEIADAIHKLNHWNQHTTSDKLDVLVVARGGGSLEDLWCFNEEVVARAIAASDLPVVSGVGHEIDFTIADFAADLRAPTPSAAAEVLTPDRAELAATLDGLAHRAKRSMDQRVTMLDYQLQSRSGAELFNMPRFAIRERQQQLDSALDDLTDLAEDTLESRDDRLHRLQEKLARLTPSAQLASTNDRLDQLQRRMVELTTHRLEKLTDALGHRQSLLHAISPDVVLARGYSLTTDSTGRIIRDADTLSPGDELTTKFAKGSVRSKVES
ncbi:exodeoxyribonuclease VII large subunit [Sulfuriroseicoccus oceanibius]|uniref:Exodeoxyribonuclease 7 large subunit n=1 Tax=Sulfuriroseicoccus oceanibius TaxID=2707525 RepID=A0A6B3LCR0_9BACT|nr:exodeoxyribonuclease VII large subunit [Sulfuriroseicoccus oceanibius]QQL45962.1 exodeoxyribonuclease VII large subunit [Sulfuriroseicoccus oceanibius]